MFHLQLTWHTFFVRGHLLQHRDRPRIFLSDFFAYTMSEFLSDENTDHCPDTLVSLLPIGSQMDSGYLTFTSSCPPSPAKSILLFNQLDSPCSDHDPTSPISFSTRSSLSIVDYEHYRTTRKHIDILTQLHQRNAYHLVEEVLKNLSERDLRHCLNVCQSWKLVVGDYLHRRQRHTIKRNLFDTDQNTSPRPNEKLTSTPMQSITNLTHLKVRVPWQIESNLEEKSPVPSRQLPDVSSINDIHLAASTLSFRYGYLKYLHGPTVPKRCPICAFISIVDVNDQHG